MVKEIPLPPWRVLIVEDDPLVQLGIEQALSASVSLTIIGMVDDGYLAVEAALKDRPDLVLMDIGLPGLDGIATTQAIKAQLPEVKVVMLTSHRSEDQVLSALASGADAYCIKGGEIEVLLTAIAAVSQGALYLDAEIANNILQQIQRGTAQNIDYALTERELEVLELLVEGKSNNEIATHLYISPNTVKSHMRGLMDKLSANDRVQAAVKAVRAGLV